MEKRIEELRRIIIKKLHPECNSYADAIDKENKMSVCCHSTFTYYPGEDDIICDKCGCYTRGYENGLPITASRILQALENHAKYNEWFAYTNGIICTIDGYSQSPIQEEICDWQLTLPNGQDAELNDQTKETKEALFNILK